MIRDTTPLHILSRRDPFLERAVELLSREYATMFDLWRLGDSWTRMILPQRTEMASRERCQDDTGTHSLLAATARRRAEPVTSATDSGHHLAIPLSRRVPPIVAIGHVVGESADTLLRLARGSLERLELCRQIAELEETNESLIMQVTDDFEELSFLRYAAGQLELSPAAGGMIEMATTALVQLRQAINAENVLLVSAREATHHPVSNRVQNIEVSVGTRVLEEDACRDLVGAFAAQSLLGPVIQNNAPDPSRFPGIQQFLLVAITKGDRLHGWLVAFNRSSPAPEGSVRRYWEETRREFGTAEASIMTTAATILAARAHNVELMRQKEQLLTEMVRALVNAIEAKDQYTRGHSERVALFAERLGQRLGYGAADCQRLYLTGLLHDVGKIGVEDSTLLHAGILTEQQYAQIKQHPDNGWAILRDLDQLRDVLPGVLHHHERYDGTGYPDGLAGEEIPTDGRVLAVCDAYDAMTSDRAYRAGMPQQKAEAILRDGAGSHWDPTIVVAFLSIMPDILQIRGAYHPRPQTPRKPRPASSAEPWSIGTAAATPALH